MRTGERPLDDVLHDAIDIRRRLASEVAENDPQRSASAKTRQLRRLRSIIAPDVEIADAIIAAGLPLGGKPGKQLDEAFENLREALTKAHPGPGQESNRTFLDRIIATGLTPTVATDYERWKPLHWVLEVPDVIVDHGGFDAVIGNPPFLGGKKISPATGSNNREYLVNQVARSATGNADLVGYFLLRAVSLLRGTGTLGVIATNTIAQGDTREVGLDQLVRGGFTLTRGVQSAPWPAASANLEYAAVWGTCGPVAETAVREADGVPARRISTLLEPAGRVGGRPVQLTENQGIAFIGNYVLGMGFVLEPDEAQAWIAEDDRNREVLFPYLNGEDLNSRPDCSPSRWVIDFNDRIETEASQYHGPWEHIRTHVRPERLTKDADKYPRMVHEWWKFWNSRPGLRRAIADLDEVLVIARVSKTVMPVRVPTGQVASEACVVFATDSGADQAVLSSSLHQLWAVMYGSSMRADVRYTPSDVFETFPRPEPTPELESTGRTLDTQRREIMLRRDLGLTKLYNLVNDPEAVGDPDVDQMRELHVQVDQAVAAAYGWSDVELGHGFHMYRQVRRWTISPAVRVELMDRLLEENLRRAEQERKVSASAGRKGRSRPKTAPEGQEGLFE